MANTKIFHLTYTSVGRLPFFPNLAGCREALHRLARLRHSLALFSIVLEHLHQVALTNGAGGSAVSKATKRALGTMVATPFDETDIRTVGSRDYVENLFRYHLVQPAKHNVPGPPALRAPASSISSVRDGFVASFCTLNESCRTSTKPWPASMSGCQGSSCCRPAPTRSCRLAPNVW